MTDWMDILDTTIAYRQRFGLSFRDVNSLRSEVAAFFSRQGDSARWFPINRLDEIIKKFEHPQDYGRYTAAVAQSKLNHETHLMVLKAICEKYDINWEEIR